MEITTKLEFDAGHRIPHHKSVCKNLHGHRYTLEVTIKGDVVSDISDTDFGMVMDFKDAKDLMILRCLVFSTHSINIKLLFFH